MPGLLFYFPDGTDDWVLACLELSLGDRPVVVLRTVDDCDFDPSATGGRSPQDAACCLDHLRRCHEDIIVP
jgi:hypothetical protein